MGPQMPFTLTCNPSSKYLRLAPPARIPYGPHCKLTGGQGQHLLCCVCRSIKEFVKKIEEGNKPLDILVNNASIFITGDEVTEDGLEVRFFTVCS